MVNKISNPIAYIIPLTKIDGTTSRARKTYDKEKELRRPSCQPFYWALKNIRSCCCCCNKTRKIRIKIKKKKKKKKKKGGKRKRKRKKRKEIAAVANG